MAFPTYPFSPISFVDKINSFYNNGRKFKSELSFSFEGVFGSPAIGPITLNYNPEIKHFFGLEVYPNPYYVGPPDNEFYTRSCVITQFSPTEWYMEYNDDGPDGILFYGRKNIDPIVEGFEGFYADISGEWDNYDWANRVNIEGGGTITISDIREAAIDPTLFFKRYTLEIKNTAFACEMTPILSPWLFESLVNEGRTPFYYEGDPIDASFDMKTTLFDECFPTHYGRITDDVDDFYFFLVWGKDKDTDHKDLEPFWRIEAYRVDPPDNFISQKPIMSPHSEGSLYYEGTRRGPYYDEYDPAYWDSNNSDRLKPKLNDITTSYSDISLFLKVELRSQSSFP